MRGTCSHLIHAGLCSLLVAGLVLMSAGAGCDPQDDPGNGTGTGIGTGPGPGTGEGPELPGPDRVVEAYLRTYEAQEPDPTDKTIEGMQDRALQYVAPEAREVHGQGFAERVNQLQILVVKAPRAEILEQSADRARVQLMFDYASWYGLEEQDISWDLVLAPAADGRWLIVEGP